MNLSELTDKIYAEGVEKGNQEAQHIIDEANAKAAQILAKAEKDAADKVAKAEKKAEELEAHTKAELKLYTEQALNALKTAVVDLLNGEIVAANVKAATADAKFMQGVITKIAEAMAKDGDVRIEAKDAEALKKYFAANTKGLLDKGVKIEEVKGLKTNFQIVSEKGGYKLAFGDAEFEAFFKAFLRPQLIELLF
jgi:V/A-type H+-transporting ATPase subunit E